jgi:hypothetical protein
MLDGPFLGLADGVGDGGYALWLGSGISLARVEGLRGVVRRVIEFLRLQIDPTDPECPFRRALEEVIELAKLSATDLAHVDVDHPVDDWLCRDTLLGQLAFEYSSVLDVRVKGHPADFLLWEGVDVTATYGSDAIEPDVEHLCIAILIAEGVAPEVASANWDGLIERAAGQLGLDLTTVIKVCITNADFQQPDARSRLLKFHGCAVRASRDPNLFRRLLIARQSQVTRWPHEQAFSNMVAELTSLAANRRTLMIGLSAQDSDIQDLFARAGERTTWAWDDTRPPHAFAEEELGPRQMNILKVVYGEQFDDHGEDIYERSRVRAFAKSLLIGLVLTVLCRKLQAFAAQCETSVTPSEMDELASGLTVLRDLVATSCGADRLAFLHNVLPAWSVMTTIFDSGVLAASPPWRYRPISATPVHQISSDPMLASGGTRELAAALAALGRGHAAGKWQIAGVRASAGAVEVQSGLGNTRVFLCADSESGSRLIETGVVDVTDDQAVIIYSRAPAPRRRRSPSGAPGRTGRSGLREIGMSSILRNSASLAEVEDQFGMGTVL